MCVLNQVPMPGDSAREPPPTPSRPQLSADGGAKGSQFTLAQFTLPSVMPARSTEGFSLCEDGLCSQPPSAHLHGGGAPNPRPQSPHCVRVRSHEGDAHSIRAGSPQNQTLRQDVRARGLSGKTHQRRSQSRWEAGRGGHQPTRLWH